MEEAILSIDAFVRSFAVNRGTPFAAFLGAGASVSSGVPSAEQCLWEWKRSIFLSQNPGLESQFDELSLAGVRERLQRWLDGSGKFPPAGHLNEYSVYIEHCYPIEEDRRRYFDEKIRGAIPHIGYRLLCFLSELRMIRSVWTPNFDGLAARAAAATSITPIEVGPDCAKIRLLRQRREGELLCVSVHGDYRYDLLKNTSVELQDLEAELKEALIEELRKVPCVVVGYSGRDASLIDTFREAYATPGSGALYWCTFGNQPPPDTVSALISDIRKVGQRAYVVPTNGFDDLMVRLARHSATDSEQAQVKELLASFSEEKRLSRSLFIVPDYPVATVVKSNAFELASALSRIDPPLLARTDPLARRAPSFWRAPNTEFCHL